MIGHFDHLVGTQEERFRALWVCWARAANGQASALPSMAKHLRRLTSGVTKASRGIPARKRRVS